jgi:hypothetical protein
VTWRVPLEFQTMKPVLEYETLSLLYELNDDHASILAKNVARNRPPSGRAADQSPDAPAVESSTPPKTVTVPGRASGGSWRGILNPSKGD